MRTLFHCGTKHIYQVKMCKTPQVRTAFGSWGSCRAKRVSKSKCKKRTSGSDHFWKFGCPKIARLCGAKHISKSKCKKHVRFGLLLEDQMPKKGTPSSCKAHFDLKMHEIPKSQTTFGRSNAEKVRALMQIDRWIDS